MTELVSVVLPMHNGIRHVEAALDSILAQTWPSLEVVVIDDGSTDGSAELVLARYGDRVRMLRQPQAGHPAARNAGIRAATGGFLSFLDHDDFWPENKIDLQMQVLLDDPTVDAVMGHALNFLDEEIPEAERARIAVPLHPLPGTSPGTMLIRREALDRVGAFDESKEMGEFLDWYIRAQTVQLNIRMLPEVLLHRRIHNTNFSRSHHHLRREYLEKVKQMLDARRRGAAGAN